MNHTLYCDRISKSRFNVQGMRYNPFTYKGYYYDNVYYLNSRYYDSNTGWFAYCFLGIGLDV